jgi:ATP-binding cassette subfamily B multidrug efflux pump
MSEEKTKKKVFDFSLLMRVLSYARPYKWKFGLSIFFTLVLGVLGPVRPLIVLKMVDEYILKRNEEGLLFWTYVFIGVLLLEAIIQFAQTYLTNWLGQTIIKDIRVRLFDKITGFKLKFFDNTPIGALVTRAISDIEAISDIFSQGLLTIIGDVLKLSIVIGLMFYVNWEFALLCLLPVPLLLIATRIFAGAIKKAYQLERQQVTRLNTFVQEHITGMSIVQIFNREKMEMDRFQEINKGHRSAHIKAVWAYSIFFPVVEILSALSLALLMLWGILQVNDNVTDGGALFGQLFAYILWIHMLYRPIRQLADRFNVLQRGVVRAERVFKIIDTEENIDNSGSIKEHAITGNIEFKKVWFAYTDENYVLKEISFAAKAGETVAFVGATGAGKTSIINLLSRFYEYQKGEILVDGNDLRDYDLNVVRRNIATVLQDVFLFSDTILNNITLKDETITKEQVIEAAKAVGAHHFIMKLPGDYNYNVRERGGMLSVGQRQLIAFIRAYVYNPKILVLDEATSSVDTESELLIQQAIKKLTENRTSVVIAHRLSTIQKAHKIIVLDHGEIIEMGTHDELLKLNGQYRKLFDLQFHDD